MEKEVDRDEKEEAEKSASVPEKKRKTEPEVTIAPSGPGGPDISVE